MKRLLKQRCRDLVKSIDSAWEWEDDDTVYETVTIKNRCFMRLSPAYVNCDACTEEYYTYAVAPGDDVLPHSLLSLTESWLRVENTSRGYDACSHSVRDVMYDLDFYEPDFPNDVRMPKRWDMGRRRRRTRNKHAGVFISQMDEYDKFICDAYTPFSLSTNSLWYESNFIRIPKGIERNQLRTIQILDLCRRAQCVNEIFSRSHIPFSAAHFHSLTKDGMLNLIKEAFNDIVEIKIGRDQIRVYTDGFRTNPAVLMMTMSEFSSMLKTGFPECELFVDSELPLSRWPGIEEIDVSLFKNMIAGHYWPKPQWHYIATKFADTLR